MIRFAIVAMAALVVQGCPPSPTPPTPDASDAAPPPPPQDASTPSATACANLAAVGCAEGKVSNCAATLDHVVATKLTTVDVPCLASRKTKAELRACGFVECK